LQPDLAKDELVARRLQLWLELFIDFESAKVKDSDRLFWRISISANPRFTIKRLRSPNIFV
jgi:hypothetical protein